MYLFPTYTKYSFENNTLIVYSELFKNKIALDETRFINEFYSIVENNGCENIDSELKEFLHNQDLLQSKEEINECIRTLKDIYNKCFFITILPTEACNFHCRYCYETHQSRFMSKGQYRTILEYIKHNLNRIDNLVINWFGGEPLLENEAILSFMERINGFNLENINFVSNMTTNGYLLKKELFLHLYNLGVTNFEITLDGPQHDLLRKTVSGEGTYDTILKNLIDISHLPRIFDFSITIRRNLLNQESDISWYREVVNLLDNDKRFYFFPAIINDWGGAEVKSLNLIKEEDKKQLRNFHNHFLDENKIQRYGKGKEVFSHICQSSCKNGLIFRPNGNIEKCTIALGHDKNIVGSFTERGQVDIGDENKIWCNSMLQDECYQCDDLLACMNLSCRKKIVIDGGNDYICVCKQ